MSGTDTVGRVATVHDLTAVEQASAIRAGELSPVDLVAHYLTRIDRFGASLGAFAEVTADRAEAAARAAQKVIDTGDELPPLHGVPLAIKDLTVTAGVKTRFGSAVFDDYLPNYDDDVVGFLAAAGTISLGKTNVPEFGLSCYTENKLGPAARNPHDPSRMAGGSSGGAAAAVASGLLPFAHGTDGGGSIRIPAAMCGLVGIKSSRGLISRGPVGSDPLGLSVHGPLARTTADAAALLEAMTVPVLSEPYFAADRFPAGSFTIAAGRDPGRLRIGRTLDTPIESPVIDPAVRRAFDDTTVLLTELGHHVEDVSLPNPPGLLAAFVLLWAALAHGTPLPPGAGPELMPLTRHLLDRGARSTAAELIRAQATVQAAGRALVRAMLPYDCVLTPTVALLPPPVGYFTDSGDPAQDFARQLAFTPWTAQLNITGQPAINVPLQWTPSGLPIGMQLIGRPGGEPTLISLCGQLERARPWIGHRPAQW